MKSLSKLGTRKIFLDDIWGTCGGSYPKFDEFLSKFNEVGRGLGITFTGTCAKFVEFLNITTWVDQLNGKINTKMFVKSTDPKLSLNRRSGIRGISLKDSPVGNLGGTL